MGGTVGKLPNSYGAFEGLMGKMGKVPQPVESPTRQTLPEQDHGAMEGKMLPPEKPTGSCFLKYVFVEKPQINFPKHLFFCVNFRTYLFWIFSTVCSPIPCARFR